MVEAKFFSWTLGGGPKTEEHIRESMLEAFNSLKNKLKGDEEKAVRYVLQARRYDHEWEGKQPTTFDEMVTYFYKMEFRRQPRSREQ